MRIFTEDAEYRFSPFRPPVVGAEAIHAFWEGVTSAQEDVAVRMGFPFVASDLVAGEWWATMIEDGEETTIPGCLLLRFAADGRCRALREYWFQKGRPPRAAPRLGRVAPSLADTSRCQALGRVRRGHPVDDAPNLEPVRGLSVHISSPGSHGPGSDPGRGR